MVKLPINHLILCDNHSKCGYATFWNNSYGECIIYEKDIKGIQPRIGSKNFGLNLEPMCGQ